MNEPTSPEDLAAILKREYEAADDYHDQIEQLQEEAFRYYEAQPFGNEIDGRSQIVLPDVQETCDAMLGIILKMFVSGDRVVEFEATDEDDEQSLDDATVAIEHVFMRQQDGYRVLNDTGMDGLQRKIGIFKVSCEEDEKVSRQWVEFAHPLQLGMIEGEVEDVRENEDGSGRALVKTQRTIKRYTIHSVPTDEYRFSPAAAHEDTADYQAHVRPMTRSDLVEMGFDRDQVYSLPSYTQALTERVESNKLDSYNREESTPALEEVLLCEEYAHIDVDGDGIAELVKCYRVENEILIDAETGEPSIETIDEQPFSVFCPFPRQHRLIGYSLADKVMDLQLLRSHFARQLIDGMAFANMPRPYVDMAATTDETLDDLLNPIPGAPVRGQGPNGVTNLQTHFNIGDSLQAMEWVSREKEGRTGVGRSTPTLDENSLNNQTATEFAGREGKAETQQEYIARNLAEAMARAFAKLYRLMRVEAEPFRIKVDGKYRLVDPSQWPEDMNVRVNVGLGNGSKEKRIMARTALLGPLQAAIEQGLSGPEHAFNWFDGMARDTGVGQGEDFMYDPSDPEVQQRMAAKEQQPDADVIEVQGKLELEREKAGADAALQRQKAEEQALLQRQKTEADIETQRQKHAMDMQVMRERAALESELARDKAAEELRLARERMAAEAELKREFADANVSQNRPGGSLAE
ncbi:portal protein [Pelagerythrobacter marinus]|uniref:portal protein n=1 Tax=Pelagerythrobacter marinus TaxID=538382 RepID=UPI002AC9B1A3|nr:hypothetical protein [Pelagerythrobacter marinus]WPZ05497.1 hypothetical protein T8T98_08630 [Pelagerythrobacter marinus]